MKKGLIIGGLALLGVACNAILGLGELSPYDDTQEAGASSGNTSSGNVDPGDDGGSSGNDGGSSGQSEGDAGTAPCDPTETPDVDNGIFVRFGESGDGRMNNPFNSLYDAIQALSASADAGPIDADAGTDAGPAAPRKTIYVYDGTYGGATQLIIKDVPSFRLDGAWTGPAGAWVRDCSKNNRATTIINSTRARGLVVQNVPGESMISNIAIYTPPPGGLPDLSRIGLQVIDSGPLKLFNTIILADNGTPGATAQAGTNLAGQCAGDDSTCFDPPAPGLAGDAGASAAPGLFVSAGYVPGDGTNGDDGLPGQRGASADPQSADDCATGCSAAMGECATTGTTTLTAGKALCTCGGGAGSGGRGGKGGGASVAILTNGKVTVEYSILQCKNGGAASTGGAGATGDVGGDGNPGADLYCPLSCCDDGSGACILAKQDPGLVCPAPAGKLLKGGLPQTGGHGGAGGNGGDGAGGPAYTVVTLGDAGAVSAPTSLNQVDHGAGGLGGSPDLNGPSASDFHQPDVP